ncbi:flavodoxin family protein [Rhodococcus rhodnii]|uniref:NAD(P)H dehydrogenase (Quinone) n=2 Tax=Rhodococcus rhodnii TaxID=38312 RepID=R7WTD8_9NOCA|nr:NAD(P)H-dependent oxidoreductase [Rhodococcus rhodnii]EOM77394.1 NAD(P)H dehydrogenase (quinone) [Rhodococcus rhodnii LMG 5362]TXG90646.1 flavodoxin family protein [Rhodococcus rhodnii]
MTVDHPPTPGSALWVLAHPRQDSLNGHLFRAGVEALSRDYDVATSDLYAMGFDPVLGEDDLGEPAGRPGNLAVLAGEAYAQGRLQPEVEAEHAKLAAAELLVLQFPLWWYGPPAILKGWLDRVLTDGFAYDDELDPELGTPRRYGDGGLTRRRALVVVTAGEDERTLGPRGVSGDLDSLLFPLTHGALWYVGIDVVDLHVVHDADGLSSAGVEREIRRLRDRLAGLDSEPVRSFRRLRDGDYPTDLRALHPELLPGRTDLGIHRRSASLDAG